MLKARRELDQLMEAFPICSDYLDDNWMQFIETVQLDLISLDYSWRDILKGFEQTLRLSSPMINTYRYETEKKAIALWNKTIESLIVKFGITINPIFIP